MAPPKADWGLVEGHRQWPGHLPHRRPEHPRHMLCGEGLGTEFLPVDRASVSSWMVSLCRELLGTFGLPTRTTVWAGMVSIAGVEDQIRDEMLGWQPD
jgi:hypothetical protein